ncbi:MAG: hypothetical protein IKX43_02190 [Paludibacteraceae bacterium]|nr:hypothetical protein [Paludibacteraceae bacterium]
MPSIKNLEMVNAVSSHKNISVKKSLFSTKFIYEPTQSPLKAIVQEYSSSDGERLTKLLNLPIDKMSAEIEKNGKPEQASIGQFRLEICLSEDSQFCALQLFRFSDFRYNAIFEPQIHEGKDVETITKLL